MADRPERWLLTHEGVDHVVEIVDAGLGRRATWTVDGEEVASERTSDETVTLDGGEHGAVKVRLPAFVGPARRVTWWGHGPDLPAMGAALLNRGGTDLDPEPGSKAAVREAWIREHPRRYAVRRTAAAAAGVAGPIVVVWLLARFALPAIPWPDWSVPWPRIPWPDWSIPWPDIPWPSVPWPDVSVPRLDVDWPDWVRALAEYAKYVWPVVLALVLARREVTRRRDQDARKREAASRGTAVPDRGAEGGNEREDGEPHAEDGARP